ncbi:MAG: outer membrane protein [Comamonadaceae bacterium]|nr:MAG: outer membrane protein [Comamonadaceae bacterium]
MKKSLIALAVLAASGAAMAQSTVTLYGIADVFLASNKTDTGAVNGALTQSMLISGGVNTSRWGLKGSEDLGGGLKANFDFQQGFNIDTGAASVATAAFNRQSWVGFSGGFGAVRLGNTTTPFDDVSGASDAVFDSKLAPMNYVFKSTGYNARPGNTIYYQAPNMSGFSGAFSYSLGEDKTLTTGATSTTSLNLTYGAGPLAVQFGYQVQDIVNATVASSDAKFTRLGASYNFGAATAKLTYGKTDNVGSVTGSNATDYQLGVDVPVSAALTLSASYAKSTDSKTAPAFNQTRTGFGLGGAYTLSKRTYVYGGYESDTATNAAPAADAKHSVFAIGLNHKF